MTPFDGTALLAMLRAFYPTVTRAALERARRERPEYFAGGALIGRHGEVLRLADGRLFDLAFAAWTAESRWQVLDVTHAGPSVDDPFALEPGPLVPIDIPEPAAVVDSHTFEQLAAGALEELGAVDGVLAAGETAVGEAASSAALEDAFEREIGGAGRELDGQLASMWAADPSELVEVSDGMVSQVHSESSEYPDPDTLPSDDVPVDDPGEPPGGGDDEGGPREPEI